MALVLLPGADGKPSRVIGYDRFDPGEGTVAHAEPAAPTHPAILLIPGFTLGRRRWPDDFCQRLVAAGYTVVRMDNRDSGDSTRYEALGTPDVMTMLGRGILGLKMKAVPYDLEAMVDDSIGLMEALGFPRFHAAGASMGGMIVQLLALRAPAPLLSAGIIMSSPGGRRYSFAKISALRALLRVPPADRQGQIEHFVGMIRLLGGDRPFEEARVRAFAEDQLTARPSRPGMARQFARPSSPAPRVAWRGSRPSACPRWSSTDRSIRCSLCAVPARSPARSRRRVSSSSRAWDTTSRRACTTRCSAHSSPTSGECHCKRTVAQVFGRTRSSLQTRQRHGDAKVIGKTIAKA